MPMVEIECNLPDIISKFYDYNHVEFHTYMMASCILSIGKGVKRYYYSAGMPYSQFDCKLRPDEILCCAHYDLFILWTVSNSQTEFISTGGSLSRFEKVKQITKYPISRRYLNVCVMDLENCGVCFKCKRTLIELDATGKLQDYGDVFDLDKYLQNRKRILEEAYISVKEGDEMQLDTFGYINSNLSTVDKLLLHFRLAYRKIMHKNRK